MIFVGYYSTIFESEFRTQVVVSEICFILTSIWGQFQIDYTLDIQIPPEVRYVDPKNILKTPNLRKYDWMS